MGNIGPNWPDVHFTGKEVDTIAKKAKDPPIMENEFVKELLSVLRENNASSMQDFLAVLQQVGTMEKQLDAAVNELAAMRHELAEAQRQNHPLKNAMQKAVIVMQGQVLDLRDRLTVLKQSVIEGCKAALADFKEKGITALDNITRFFKVKPLLENMRDSLAQSVEQADKAISKIEAISTEYHKAGQHLKNIGRVVLGKAAIAEAKPPGKLTKVVAAPFRVERGTLAAIQKTVETAIHSFSKLEDRARPSIQKAIKTHSKQAKQKQAAPKCTRTAAHADR